MHVNVYHNGITYSHVNVVNIHHHKSDGGCIMITGYMEPILHVCTRKLSEPLLSKWMCTGEYRYVANTLLMCVKINVMLLYSLVAFLHI